MLISSDAGVGGGEVAIRKEKLKEKWRERNTQGRRQTN